MTEDDMLKLARECAATVWEQSVSVPDSYIRNGKMDSLMEVQSALAAIRLMHERGEKLAGALAYIAETTSDEHDMRKAQAALTKWRNP